MQSLTRWIHSIRGYEAASIVPASEDASFRRYFRVSTENDSLIAMDAPVEKEDTGPFIRIALRFRSAGLNVPRIIESDPDQGFVLMTDFGSTTYLDALCEQTANQLYSDAIDSIVTLQAASFEDPQFLPPYDAHLLREEMELFRSWYLGVHRAKDRRDSDDVVLDQSFDQLAESALDQPCVWVHLDYHSRNLMRTREQNPGILDFQDARLGPITYDLASLLRDCYVAWPQLRINAWIAQYLNKARQRGLPVGDDNARFEQWFDWMGIQRHLKATGIFCRLNYRDSKPAFVRDIPRVMSYIADVSGKYKQLRPLNLLITRLMKHPA